MLSLMRRCGHAANGAGDFAAAHVWFDCAFALSGSANDLLSAANMRVKLLPTSSVAGAIYKHILATQTEEPNAPSPKNLSMASEKLGKLETARESLPGASAATPLPGGDDPDREYF